MTVYVMLIILIGGYIAFTKLPVNDLPNIEYPLIFVKTPYSGAMPETIAQTVTMPLEREFNSIRGVKEIASTSGRGSSEIVIKFHFDKNIDDAAREVQAAIDRSADRLPREIDSRPVYMKIGASNAAHIIYMIMTSSTHSIGDMRNYADSYIQKRLERIPGVANVDIFGAPYAIRIQVNPELLAAREIDFETIVGNVRKHSADKPLGAIKTGTKTLTLELEGRLQEVEDFENLVIAEGPVRLKDVAEVVFEPESSQEFIFATKDDKTRALVIGISKQNRANTVAISNQVHEQLALIMRDLPPSITLDPWFDKALWINESVLDISWSLVFAFMLVSLVIYFSLGRISEALIPSIALPLSLIGTFIVMYAFNFSLDILSLLALTLSVGFVVDDAIVVLENIVRHQEEGASPIEASLIGSKQIGFTIVSMTLSLVAVFIPLLFMGGMNGLLFQEFSITLAVAILISGFISLSLTPMLCSRFLTKHQKETRLQIAVEKTNAMMVAWYQKTLKWSIAHPKIILSTAVLSFIITIPLFTYLPVQLFPNEDRGFIHSFMTLPEGVPDQVADKYQEQVTAVSQSNPYVAKSLIFRWDTHLISFMELVDRSQRPEQPIVVAQVQKALDAVPGLQAFTGGMQLINMNMDGGDNSYEFLLQGMDEKELMLEAKKLHVVVSQDQRFASAHLGHKEDSPKLVVNLIEDQAHRFNVDRTHVQTLLQHAYSGVSLAKTVNNNIQHKIFVELAPEYKGLRSSLNKLQINVLDPMNPKPIPIPLKSVATWKDVLGTPVVKRVDQLPAITVNYKLKPETAPNEGLKMMEGVAAANLPLTITGKHYGMAAMINETSGEALWLLLAAVVVMYIVLGILYESFIHPLTILSALPFACLGGVLTLLLFRESLSIYSIVGFLLLVGIVKKNGIMMIDYALDVRKNKQITAEEAIIEGCLTRFRPITMTTVAAIMGALPIAIGFGDGAETRRGLGLVITGGLLFSQLLTLYLTPVLFLLIERLRTRIFR